MPDKIKFQNAPTYGPTSTIQAADIAFSIHTQVDSSFYDILYPEHEWYDILEESQVMGDINAGATSYSYITRDKTGVAAFIGNGPNNDIPMVAQSAGAIQVPIGYSAVGAEVTNEDARQYQFGFNGNLAQDLGEAMRKACDNLVETTVIFGYEPLNFNPWINYPGITTVTAATGASGDTTWAKKTPMEIVRDINNALQYMWENSRTLFRPTEIWVPLEAYGIMTSTPMVLGDPTTNTSAIGLVVTIMEYVVKNNVMTRVTGRELKIHPSRYLAGAVSADVNRMVVMDRKRDYQCLPFPMPYLLSQPIPVPLAAQWYAEQKFGSFHVRQQGSMLYVDGI
jgi:hypothetical protein